jgi:hypothetical protein
MAPREIEVQNRLETVEDTAAARELFAKMQRYVREEKAKREREKASREQRDRSNRLPPAAQPLA